MNSDQLSNRLATVAAHIPLGAFLADIGSDHAYLPCFLAKEGRVRSAIAGEVVEGPFRSSREQIETAGMTHLVEARLGNGLEVIHAEDQIDTISICGMGGDLIARILEEGRNTQKLEKVKRLVLQPNNGEYRLRKWLYDHQYQITQEEILEENTKIYEIIVAEPAPEDSRPTERELLFGPILVKEKSPVFIRKWQGELIRQEIVKKSLEKAAQDTSAKMAEMEKRISLIREVIS